MSLGSLLFGVGAVALAGGGYICSSMAESRKSQLEYLLKSKPVTIRQAWKQLKEQAGPNGSASGVFELAGFTWAPNEALVQSRMDSQPVILSRVSEKEVLDVPYQREVRRNGRTFNETVLRREERELSSVIRGPTLRIADDSSFQGTGVSATQATKKGGQVEGLDFQERKAGVLWVDVDRQHVPEELWVHNGTKRENAGAINININSNEAMSSRVVGVNTVEHIVPRTKPIVAIGELTLQNKALTLQPVSPTLGSSPIPLSLVLHYGTPASYRADTLGSIHSLSTASNVLYGLGVASGAAAGYLLAKDLQQAK